MRLLIDENISYRVKKYLQDDFNEVIHISDVNLQANKDSIIFEYCKNNQIDILVTFDEDYKNLVLLKNIPPKIVLFKTGNLSTKKIANKIITNKEAIIQLIQDEEMSYLEIDNPN